MHRPTHIDPSEFADVQVIIRTRVNELVTIGETLKVHRDDKHARGEKQGLFSTFSSEARGEKNAFLDLKRAVYLLEEDVEEFQAVRNLDCQSFGV